MSESSLNVCVFCASSPRVNQGYLDLARDMGALCADQGWRLIYGGGRRGLMGAAADAALAGGAEVEGIIPRHLQEKEVAHSGLTKLSVVETMHERQMQMAERADGFVILPGGTGTMAELFEIVTWRQLALHQKPIVLINYKEYWTPLIAMIEKAMDEHFLHSDYRDAFHVLDALDGTAEFLIKNNVDSVIKSDLL